MTAAGALSLVDRGSQLPHGWAWAGLSELGEYGRGRSTHRPRNDPRLFGGPYPLVQTGDVREANGFIRKFEQTYSEAGLRQSRLWPTGTLCITIAANIADTAILTFPACFPDSVVGFVAEKRPQLVRFVEYFLRTVQDELRRIAPATAQKNINLAMLDRVRVSVPPENELRRIVDTLDVYFSRLDAAVSGLERAQANLKRYRASVLKSAVEGRLVPTEAELAREEGRDYEPASVLLERILVERRRRWEEAELAKMEAKGKPPKNDKWKAKYKEPAGPDVDELPELPEGWCWATLPMLGELGRGKSKHRPRNDPRLLGGRYPFVQTGDVRGADGFLDTYVQTYSEFGLQQSRLWPAGTLCITIAANIAETAILTFDACFPDSVVGFLAPGQPTLVRFVEYFMRTARAELRRYAPATAQKNINLQVLNGVAVPLPPHAEQARIVDAVERALSVAAQNTESVERTLGRCGRLRRSVLKWALEGKLVRQEPDDEPASDLLERIRLEREADPEITGEDANE